MDQISQHPVDMQIVADSIPLARLEPYVELCKGNTIQALNFYFWNIEISSAFWGSFHLLEVSIRNSMHLELGKKFGQNWWLDPHFLHSEQKRTLEKTIEFMKSAEEPFDDGDVISELNFGFWVALLSNKYHQALWANCLVYAFPGHSGQRKELYKALDRLRKLRNRVAHHEPIHRRNLYLDQESLCSILGRINPEVEKLLRNASRVPNVLSDKELKILGTLSIRF